MSIIEKMKKIHYNVWYPMTIKKMIDIIVAIPFVIIIYILVTLCYLVEHVDNLLSGNGWTGMNLW